MTYTDPATTFHNRSNDMMTDAERHELSALLGKALGEACYLNLAQKQRLKELLYKQNIEKETINDN